MEDEDGYQIRVLTYNVNWGYCRDGLATGMCHRIVQAIRDADADVVCLQETHDGWELFLRQQLGDRYPYMTWRHHLIPHVKTYMDEGSSAGGLAFLSAYPLEEVFHAQPEVAGSFFPGACVAVRTPAGIVDILNVHLRPPVSSSHKPSVMALFQTGLIRKAELKYFIREACEQAPALVVGDFNESRSGDAMRWLMGKARGYRDALALHDETAVTWKWPLRMGLCLKGSYDHVMFVPARLHAVACEVMTQYELVSDHIPVCATFIIKPASPLSVPSHATDSADSAGESSADGLVKPRSKPGKTPLVRVTSDLVAREYVSTSCVSVHLLPRITITINPRRSARGPLRDSDGAWVQLGAGGGAGVYDMVDTTRHLILRRASFPDLVSKGGPPLLSPRGRARALGGLAKYAAAPCECATCGGDAAGQPPLFAARSVQSLGTEAGPGAPCTAHPLAQIPIQAPQKVDAAAAPDDDFDAVVVSVADGVEATGPPPQPKKKRGSLFFVKPKSHS